MEGERILQCLVKSKTIESYNTLAQDVKHYLSQNCNVSKASKTKSVSNCCTFCLKLIRCCIEALKENSCVDFWAIFQITQRGIEALRLNFGEIKLQEQKTLVCRLEKLLFHVLLHCAKEYKYSKAFQEISGALHWLFKWKKEEDTLIFSSESEIVIKKAYDVHLSYVTSLQKEGYSYESKLTFLFGLRLLFLSVSYQQTVVSHLEEYCHSLITGKREEITSITTTPASVDFFSSIIQANLQCFTNSSGHNAIVMIRILFNFMEVLAFTESIDVLNSLQERTTKLSKSCNQHHGKVLLKYVQSSLDMQDLILPSERYSCKATKGFNQTFTKFSQITDEFIDAFEEIKIHISLFIISHYKSLSLLESKMCLKFTTMAIGKVKSLTSRLLSTKIGFEEKMNELDSKLAWKLWIKTFQWAEKLLQYFGSTQMKSCKDCKTKVSARHGFDKCVLVIAEACQALITKNALMNTSPISDVQWMSNCLYNAGLAMYKAESYADAGKYLVYSLGLLIEVLTHSSEETITRVFQEASFTKKVHLLIEACSKGGEVELLMETIERLLHLPILSGEGFSTMVELLCKGWVSVQIKQIGDNWSLQHQPSSLIYRALSDHLPSDMESKFSDQVLSMEHELLLASGSQLSPQTSDCLLQLALERKIAYFEEKEDVIRLTLGYLELINLRSESIQEDTRIDICRQTIALLEEKYNVDQFATKRVLLQDLTARCYLFMGIRIYRREVGHGPFSAITQESLFCETAGDQEHQEETRVLPFGLSYLVSALTLWRECLCASSLQDARKDMGVARRNRLGEPSPSKAGKERTELELGTLRKVAPFSYTNSAQTEECLLQLGLLFSLHHQVKEAIETLKMCVDWRSSSERLSMPLLPIEHAVLARIGLADLLVKHYLLRQAHDILHWTGFQDSKNEVVRLYVSIARARIFLLCNKITEVEACLDEVKSSGYLEGKSIKAVLLRAEYLNLCSKLQSALRVQGISPMENEELDLDALKIYRTLVSLAEGMTPVQSHFVLDRLLDVLLTVARRLQKSGAVPEAMHYLKEGSELADSHCLPSRFLLFKTELVRVAFLTENSDEHKLHSESLNSAFKYLHVEENFRQQRHSLGHRIISCNWSLAKCAVLAHCCGAYLLQGNRSDKDAMEILSVVKHSYVQEVGSLVSLFEDSMEACIEKSSKKTSKRHNKKSTQAHRESQESSFPSFSESELYLKQFSSELVATNLLRTRYSSLKSEKEYTSTLNVDSPTNPILQNALGDESLPLCLHECMTLFIDCTKRGVLSAKWRIPFEPHPNDDGQNSLSGAQDVATMPVRSTRKGKKGFGASKTARLKRTGPKKEVDLKTNGSSKELGPAPEGGIVSNKLEHLLSRLGVDGDVILVKGTLQLCSLFAGRTDAPKCATFHNLSVAQSLHRQLLSTLTKRIGKIRKSVSGSTNSCGPTKSFKDSEELLDKFRKARSTLQEFCNPACISTERFQKEVVDVLPKEWRVCTLTMMEADCKRLLISRMQAGEMPLVFNISLRSEAADWSGEEWDNDDDCDSLARGLAAAFQTDPLEDLQDILSSSHDSMKVDDVKVWWKQRLHLDKRLEKYLLKLENKWLSCWKGVLLGEWIDANKAACLEQATKGLADALHQHCGKTVHKDYLKLLLDASSYLNASQIQQGLSELLGSHFSSDAEKLFEKHVRDLERHLQGKRETADTTRSMRHPVILILDGGLDRLPWESIPILRRQAVCRMPSLLLTSLRFKACETLLDHGLNAGCTFYILNPRKDLPNTEKTFQKMFQSEPDWQGIVGRAPTEEEYATALSGHELFLYCGHGTGSEYLKGDRIRRISCTATTLLMGCSSAKLKNRGKYEPHGMVLSYLLADCPAVVGNLWDVTDKDIDRFLERLLQVWRSEESRDLCGSVMTARLACHLPFLIGASPVVYGLPIKIKQFRIPGTPNP